MFTARYGLYIQFRRFFFKELNTFLFVFPIYHISANLVQGKKKNHEIVIGGMKNDPRFRRFGLT